ncbi:MFS transporter [Desulfococcaceae bacterium HSG9]|nr:MFS transporter [Desulfococcaceae bacterium HSG9]
MAAHSQKNIASSYTTLMVICCGSVFACYFASFMRFPVVPLYARSLGITTSQIGIINSTFFLVAGTLSLPLGVASDLVGRKKMAGCGLLLLACASILICFCETFIQLAGVYFCLGIGVAAFGPTMMSFVAAISPSTHLGRSYGWYTLALFCGTSLGPAVGGIITQSYGFLCVFIISGSFFFLNLIMFFFLFPSDKKPHHTGPEKEPVSANVRELFRNRPMLACWLAALGGCFGMGMFMTFIPLHALNQGLNAAHIGLVFFFQGASNALSRIPFGYLSDRVKHRHYLVMIGLVGFALSIGGFGISANLSYFTVFATILGFSMGLAFTSVGALIAEAVPPKSRGLAMGGYNTCIYLGMMLSSSVMGSIIQMIGFAGSFFICAGIILMLIPMFAITIYNQ